MESFIDLAPIVEIAFGLLAAAVLAAGRYLIPAAIKWLDQRTFLGKIFEEDQVRQYLLDALDRAVAFAKTKVDAVDTTVDIDNQIAIFAYQYLQTFVPDALERFGWTEENITDIVTAYLAQRAQFATA